MYPQQRFDKPGKSPFMDMQLIPKYAGEAPAGSVAVDPRVAQTLGWRTAIVERRKSKSVVEASATVQLNERDIVIVQTRTAGFVQRVGRLAPGDVISAGTLIAELLVPEWAGAQQEFLAVRSTGDAALTAAARQRLVLLGMSPGSIDAVERTGRVQSTMTVTAPIGGLVQELMVRQGMTLSPGTTLARINGLSSVWLEASLPEVQAGAVSTGQLVQARLSSFPGEALSGKVTAILPEANAQTRTLRVRIEVPNRQGRLRAGMFAQVRFATEQQEALMVPAEAVIRTGQRSLVYLVEKAGQFRPVEVQLGRELGDQVEVLKGLVAGQEVVSSGQFLIDSEASMQGVMQRATPTAPNSAAQAASVPSSLSAASASAASLMVHRGVGKIAQIAPDEVTIDHGPVATMKWPAMQMSFKIPRPQLAAGLKTGDAVSFGFVQTDDGFEIRDLSRTGAAK
jgi:Cu(I)/Ag(I) efflux system membrane fusion protein